MYAVGLWVLQPRMIRDGNCGYIGGMKISMGNKITVTHDLFTLSSSS
jgi:hypothetical protein